MLGDLYFLPSKLGKIDIFYFIIGWHDRGMDPADNDQGLRIYRLDRGGKPFHHAAIRAVPAETYNIRPVIFYFCFKDFKRRFL